MSDIPNDELNEYPRDILYRLYVYTCPVCGQVYETVGKAERLSNCATRNCEGKPERKKF